MKKLIFLIFSLCLQSSMSAQNGCIIYNDETNFDNSTINGSVFTNPSGTINITNELMFPIEQIENITAQLKALQALEKKVNKQQLNIEKQRELLKEEEIQRQKEKEQLNNERQNFEKQKKAAKQSFQAAIAKVKAEFEATIASISTTRVDEPIAQKIQELKTKGQRSIKSAENCLSNDFELTALTDKTTGKTIYGFSLEEIRNDPNYVFIDEYVDGLARVKRNNKYGFYDVNGNLAIEFKYDYANSFYKKVATVKNIGKWILINKNDTKLLEFEYDEIMPFEGKYNGLAKVRNSNNYYGLINIKGETVIECKYKEIYPFEEEYNGLAKVRNYSYYGLINTKGEIIIECKYQEIYPFDKNGLAKVKYDNYYGIINTKGEVIIDYKFKEVSPFDKNGLAKTKHSNYGLYGVINTKGEIIVEYKYTDIYIFDKNDLAIVVKDYQNYGVINTRGEMIIECKYSQIYPFDKNDLAIVTKKIITFSPFTTYKHYKGLINPNGLEIVPLIFKRIKKINNNYQVIKNRKKYTINKNGQCISKNKEKYKALIRKHHNNKK